jgi:hypothetical protein
MLISRKTPLHALWNILKPSRKGSDEAITFEPVGGDASQFGCEVELTREQAKWRTPLTGPIAQGARDRQGGWYRAFVIARAKGGRESA